jgi:hypothetical protein
MPVVLFFFIFFKDDLRRAAARGAPMEVGLGRRATQEEGDCYGGGKRIQEEEIEPCGAGASGAGASGAGADEGGLQSRQGAPSAMFP